MVNNHKWKGLALFGTVALAVTGLALTASAATFPKDTVITSYADNNGAAGDPQVVVLTKDGDPTGFTAVDPGTDRAWLAPIAVGPDGHLYLAQATGNGTLLDLTSGTDLTTAKVKQIAKGFLAALPHKICGIAFDAEGNVYLPLSETEDSSLVDNSYPITRIELKTGKVSQLKGTYSKARGLLIRPDANKNEILYICESGTGKVLTYNLTTDTPGDKPFATGFPAIADHGSGQIALDKQGKLFVSWQMDSTDVTTGGVFDITNGGDFSNYTKTPPVVMMDQFKTDVNGLAFDSKNNMYMGGDNHFTFVAPFNASTGKWGGFTQYANDNLGGDCESLTIAP